MKMTEHNSIKEETKDVSPACLVRLLDAGLPSPRNSKPIKITKQEVYNFLERQGVRIPKSISEYVDAMLSRIENPKSVSQAFYCESRRQVEQYLEIEDGIHPLSGYKTRKSKFYELLNTFKRVK